MALSGSSRALMTQRIKQEIAELVQGKKVKAALVIDEASLLRLEVFADLHTLTQFEQDSKPFLPIVLAGQSNLVDNLRYRNCLPLASRVVAKTHLQGSDQKTMEDYLRHHLAIAGVKRMLFNDTAVTAIHRAGLRWDIQEGESSGSRRPDGRRSERVARGDSGTRVAGGNGTDRNGREGAVNIYEDVAL